MVCIGVHCIAVVHCVKMWLVSCYTLIYIMFEWRDGGGIIEIWHILHDLIKFCITLGLRHGEILQLLNTLNDNHMLETDYKKQETVQQEE